MVTLIVNDLHDVSRLELMLATKRIPFVVELASDSEALNPPYLLVDGVPLDETRAIKWMEEYK